MLSQGLFYYPVPNAAELARLLLSEQCGFVSSAKSPFLIRVMLLITSYRGSAQSILLGSWWQLSMSSGAGLKL